MPVMRPTAGLRNLLPYITPHRKTLLVILGLLVCVSLLSLLNPWLAGLLTATVLDESNGHPNNIGALLTLWSVLLVLRTLLSFATNYYTGNTAERITADLRIRLYQHLQSLPLAYYQQRKAGETLTLLSTDATIISSFVTDTVVQLLPALFIFAGAFVMMAWLDWSIALIVVGLLPAYFLLMKIVARKLRPLSRAWVDANSHLVSVVEENLGMLSAIKAFTRESHEQVRFEDANRQLYTLARRQWRIEAALAPTVKLLGGAGVLALIWLGNSHIQEGSLTAPGLVSLLLYAALLMNPLATLANAYGRLQRTRGSAERISEFLAQHPEPTNEGSEKLEDTRGTIRFHNVSFGYPGRPRVLEGFELDIAAGETLAITGPNGAGKSTLAHLLMRFADPDSGTITIDGLDLRKASISSVRKTVGLVAQRVLLLNASIADNIAYGEPRVERGKIERAARAAHAHEFICALPDGYDTIVGDQGVRLSGGQCQRLSLARTLLKDPPILILDEATAMFDPAGEKAFVAHCHELFNSRTVILITHRPESLALADRRLDMSLSS